MSHYSDGLESLEQTGTPVHSRDASATEYDAQTLNLHSQQPHDQEAMVDHVIVTKLSQCCCHLSLNSKVLQMPVLVTAQYPLEVFRL